LYSSSSTAKFQSAICASTLECRCLLRPLLARRKGDPYCCYNAAQRQRGVSRQQWRNSKLEQKHIGAADQPYRNPDDVRQPDRAVAASAFETFGSVHMSVQIYATLYHHSRNTKST
jgi:hypothetical protein